jgi:flagellar hook-associated protein 2
MADISSPSFQAGGLASGLDTTALIDKLVAIESRPLTLITQRQEAMAVQVSTIGTLITKLSALETSAKSLSTNGVAAITATGTYSDFTATGSAASPASYTVNVDALAQSAKYRGTTEFNSSADIVPAGTLTINIGGTITNVVVAAGTTLSALISQINAAVPKASASIISTGTKYLLNINTKDTGLETAGMTVTADPGYGLTMLQQATNSHIIVDGLDIYRQNNDVTGVIPGVTFKLKAASQTNTTVTFSQDSTTSAASLQSFVDAYNEVNAILAANLQVSPGTVNPGEALSGTTVLSIQRSLSRMFSTEVLTTGKVRTMFDLGVRLVKDGTVALDKTALTAALAADPTAVNAIFSTANTGMGAAISATVRKQTNATNGTLIVRQLSLKKTSKSLDLSAERIQRHVDHTRTRLVKDFTAMEKLVNGFTSIGNYLTQLSAQQTK